MQNLTSFKYVFQITKLITFEVDYYRLGNNTNKHFSTSANQFIRSRRDYNHCGQAQESLLPKKLQAYKFYKKWDYLHLKDLTTEQHQEIISDLEILKSTYNYLHNVSDRYDISFNDIITMSKQSLKS